jgi:hypothetical protein
MSVIAIHPEAVWASGIPGVPLITSAGVTVPTSLVTQVVAAATALGLPIIVDGTPTAPNGYADPIGGSGGGGTLTKAAVVATGITYSDVNADPAGAAAAVTTTSIGAANVANITGGTP